MNHTTRNRLVIGVVLIAASIFIGVQMYFSMTPPTHADHDHAIASLDAGGFLWIKAFEGKRRNLVGRPGHVLILHWFDPSASDMTEQLAAASFAAGLSDDSSVEVAFVALAESAESITDVPDALGIAPGQLYFDGGRTAGLCGVRRWPETLIYDPFGVLAFQARGPLEWTRGNLGPQIERAKGGVEEIH